MSVRTLYLHIGHGKTGTSYQQSCFALSGDALAGAGILYPKAPEVDRAASGGVTSGNAAMVAQALGTPHAIASHTADYRGQEQHVLYSSEFLFHHMSQKKSPDDVLSLADYLGCARVEILMLIRDPMDHLRSAYLQNVQHAGLTTSIDEMAKRFNMPMRAVTLMQTFSHPRIAITVRNYSRMKDRLIEETEAWLRLPTGTLLRPQQRHVNRSLTDAEMEIQRVFNGIHGASSHLFANKVVEALPDLTSAKPAISHSARRFAHDRCANAMRRINKAIPPEQAYQFDLDPKGVPEDVEDEFVTLSEAQITEIINALAPHIKR